MAATYERRLREKEQYYLNETVRDLKIVYLSHKCLKNYISKII